MIESLGVHLPTSVRTSAEIERGCRKGLNFALEAYTGIRSRHWAGGEEFAIDLARQAVASCLQTSEIAADRVELIVACNISRCDGPGTVSYEPSTALRLKAHFGLQRAWAFDLANACAGVFTGIAIADLLLRTGVIRNALIVSGEFITHLTGTAQREIVDQHDPRMACLTLGDAGVALMLTRSPHAGVGFHHIELFTLGRYSRYCTARASDSPEGGGIMLTDSVRLSMVAAKEGTRQLAGFVEAIGQQPEDFDYLITHQTSRPSIKTAMRALNRQYGREVFSDRNVCDNLTERGNTATNTHFVALKDCLDHGTLRPGDRVLFSTVASGLVVGAASYTIAPSTAADPPSARRDVPAIQRQGGMRIEAASLAVTDPRQATDTVALARSAAEGCLRRSSHKRHEITELVFTGLYRTALLTEPAIAAIVAGELRLNDVALDEVRTFAYDVAAGGARVLTACHLVEQRMVAGAEAAMIVTSEVDANTGHATAAPLGIIPHGAAAILDWQNDADVGFRRFLFRDFIEFLPVSTTNGHISKGPAYLESVRRDDWPRIYAECTADVIRELLACDELSIAAIKRVLTSTACDAYDMTLAAELAIEPERIRSAPFERDASRERISTPQPTGSLLHAFVMAQKAGELERGDLCLLVEAGAGVQIGCALYRM
jgi:3-oxoacyl-[acyl-carrier-protein] synthase III